MADDTTILNLAVALGVGLIIGVERGWTQRTLKEGRRVAGLRTFALVGFLGGLAAQMGLRYGLGAMLVVTGAMLALVIASLLIEHRKKKSDRGITTEVALIITLALGVLAGYGEVTIAAASAVVVTVLLGLKPQLHQWLETLEQRELLAAFKFLLMSLVILPVLPNHGYGPWQSLNPYMIWLMVVLISGISFAGYIAIRTLGPRRGMFLTGLLGGLTSSTAVTISMARMARETPSLTGPAAAATLASATILYPRVLLVATTFSAQLGQELLLPLGAAAAASGLILWYQMNRVGEAKESPPMETLEPFDLATPLKFGAILAAVMLGSAAMSAWLGDVGLLVISGIAGLTDVDAPTLTAAQSVSNGLDPALGVLAILIAVSVNVGAKWGLVIWIAGRHMGIMAGLGFSGALLAGAGACLLVS